MITHETDRPGVFTVHRTEGEKPFAELHAPRARGDRKWGIKYRGRDDNQPFDPRVFNISYPNRKMAMKELEWAIQSSSAVQLCLEPDYPQSKSLGPTNRSRCPKCLNSFQNGVPQGSPEFRRCATCKTVFRKHPEEKDAS